jgi:hypothetical protein
LFLVFEKRIYLCRPENNPDIKRDIKVGKNEKNISTIDKKKKEQTWLQRKNVYSQWKKSVSQQAGQRPQKAHRFR